MISLGLVSLLLGVVASLMSSYANLVRHSSTGTSTLYPAQLALETMATDLRAAIVVGSPGTVASTDVNITKVDPWDSVRLPIPPLVTGSFTPHNHIDCISVRYFVLNETLKAETTYQDGSTDSIDAVVGISGISAQLVTPNLVELSASLSDKSTLPPRIVSMTTNVFLHLPPAVVP